MWTPFLFIYLFQLCLKCKRKNCINEFFSLLSHFILQLPRHPGPHGPHMYAHRMAMDPRFTYPAHIPRHGDPSLNRLPHNFNMQVYKPIYTFFVYFSKPNYNKFYQSWLFFFHSFFFSPSIAWWKDLTWVLGIQWVLILINFSLHTSTLTWVQLMAHLWALVQWPSSLDLLLKPACTHPTTVRRGTLCTPWVTDTQGRKGHISTTTQAWGLLVWAFPTCGLVWITRVRRDPVECACRIPTWSTSATAVMVESHLQWDINHGRKLLDILTLLIIPNTKCLQRSVLRGPCPHVPLYPTQTPLAGHAWLPCWKAQRCWPCSSCQPLLDPLLVPLISTWATFNSLGPHQELAASQLTPPSSLPLPLRFSCCVLPETMGQTASLPNRQTRSPKVDLTFSLSISPTVGILHEETHA